LRKRFGHLGLAAAGYNAGPGRVREWLDGKGALPRETPDYVAITTGWAADKWASPSPPTAADATIPQGLMFSVRLQR
jgi:soluble lytic murein transglycosylase-like protein